MLARSARARSPRPSATTDRSSRSVATARKGMGNASKSPRAMRFALSASCDRLALTSLSRTAPVCSTHWDVSRSQTITGLSTPNEAATRGA